MKKQSVLHSYWLILIAPLIAFPFMVNLRIFPFIAPNEEPKWAVLTVCALWMGLASAWIWLQKKTPLEINKPSIPAMLLGIYTVILAIGIFIGPNQTEGFIRFAFWFSCIAIFILAAWAIRHEPKWQRALVWSISIGSFIFSLRYWESYFLDYGKPNYNIAVLFSPIGHINFTGDVLIILLPFLIWVLATYKNPTLRILNWFSATTIMAILLVASSRGALGGLALALLIIAVISIKHFSTWQRKIKEKKAQASLALIISTVLASTIIYSNLPFHYRDLARVSATAAQTAAGQGKKELNQDVLQPPLVDMWVQLSPLLGARTNIFASTTAMTLDAPMLGQGTGNFAWVYPNYSNRYPDFRDPLSSVRTFTTNPHNVVLQIASQNGIPAMLIFMALLTYFWYRLFKASWQQWNGWHISGLAAVTAATFDAMFNHVFFNPASMFVFALLGGTWWGSLRIKDKQKKTIQIPSKLTGITALITILVISVWPIRWIVSEWYTGQAIAYVQYPKYESKFYQKAYGWDHENFRAVFGMGQVAYKQKRFQDSIRYFEEFERFFPYNPPALNMLGATYMVTGQLDKAEATFLRALKIYPDFEMVQQNLQRVQMFKNQQRMPQLK